MYEYQYPHPAVTADVVIFTIRDDELDLLLIERGNEPFRGCWALPGGFVDIEEDLDTAAARELAEETGIDGVFLEQLYTFGRPDRDPRERVISVAYYALVPLDKVAAAKAADDARALRWFPVAELPELAFDHADVVETARTRLAAKLDYSTIALNFLPRRFTLSQLQGVYEAVLGRALDKRNFRKRVTAMACVEQTEEFVRNGQHRPARLYQARKPGPSIEFVR